jgi:hypothetical protein
MEKKLIAKWQSKGGRYWLELYQDSTGAYSYRGDNCGGFLGSVRSDVCMTILSKLDCWPSRPIKTL